MLLYNSAPHFRGKYCAFYLATFIKMAQKDYICYVERVLL